jgi:hypothetical protein
MGTRYLLEVVCPKCGFVDDSCPYAPTCGFTKWECDQCGCVIDLEEYTGISFEDASNADEIEILTSAFEEAMENGASPEELALIAAKTLDENEDLR